MLRGMSRVRPHARALLRAVALASVAALAAVPATAGAALSVTDVGPTLTEPTPNGDGIVGPGETFALTERIRHDDLLVPVFTGMSAVAFEAEPDLTMFQNTAGYQDMTYGQERDNARPFTGVVSVDAECGAA